MEFKRTKKTDDDVAELIQGLHDTLKIVDDDRIRVWELFQDYVDGRWQDKVYCEDPYMAGGKETCLCGAIEKETNYECDDFGQVHKDEAPFPIIMPRNITADQTEILNFIAEHFGRKKNGVHVHVNEQVIEKFLSIAKYDLENRVGNVRGIYPNAGCDIITPNGLGGSWLMFESHRSWEQNSPPYTSKFTPVWNALEKQGSKHLSADSVLERRTEILSFRPNVVLLKCPTPGAQYLDIVNDLTLILEEDMLIISDTSIQHHALKPLSYLGVLSHFNWIEEPEKIFGHDKRLGLEYYGPGSLTPPRQFQAYQFCISEIQDL